MSILFPSVGDQSLADFAAQLRRLADEVERLAEGAQPSTSDLAAAPRADWWRFTRREALALIGVTAVRVGAGRMRIDQAFVFFLKWPLALALVSLLAAAYFSAGGAS